MGTLGLTPQAIIKRAVGAKTCAVGAPAIRKAVGVERREEQTTSRASAIRITAIRDPRSAIRDLVRLYSL